MTSGGFSRSPVSDSVNSIIMNANVRFVLRSRSSIQNQWPRYLTETNAS